VAESSNIYSSRSRQSVQKLLDTPLYKQNTVVKGTNDTATGRYLKQSNWYITIKSYLQGWSAH